MKIEEYQKLTYAQYAKINHALDSVLSGKVMKLKVLKLGKIDAEMPEFIANTCKVSFLKTGNFVVCSDPLADGAVIVGATSGACGPAKYPLFQDCIRTKIARDVDKPTPVKTMRYLIQKAHGASFSSAGEFAISKPGPFTCHWDGDHEICSIKLENDEVPGALGLWTFYRHMTFTVTVFTQVIYKRMETESYAQRVSHILIEKLASSMNGIVKEVQFSKDYHIHGVMISPEIERGGDQGPYLEFSLRSDQGGNYTVQDFVYPTLKFKPGYELRAGSEYDFYGRVKSDPTGKTKGLLEMTNRKHFSKSVLRVKKLKRSR